MLVEFHCHTLYSKDSLTTPEKLRKAARRKGLEKVIITDHNTTAGAVKARQLDPDLFIVGEEVMTQQGELLAAFVEEEVPPGLPAQEALARLREQGAFISVSHPFDRWRSGAWALPDLLEIAPLVDAIEVFNARCMRSVFNIQALEFAAEHDLAGTVGSDAHAAFELGRAVMRLPAFSSADELRAVIRQGEAQTVLSSPWVHLTSRYAVWRKKRNRSWTAP
jgi:predicted metal-dependent phosphoesterase TrpH